MRSSISILVVGTIAFVMACAPASNVSSTANSNANANANQAVENANAATAPSAESQTSSTGSLATPTEAYRTAYALRKKKDVEGLKKMMSKDILEFFTMIAEGEKKTLDDVVRELCEKPQAKTPDTRNEKINGDRASVEYLDEKGEWDVMDFIKEDGIWKMSFPDKGDVEIETSGPSNKKSDKP